MEDETLTQRLDRLYAGASRHDDAARAELNGLIRQKVYAKNPDPEAQGWLVGLLAKSPHVKVRKMALGDPDEMQKKCAGLALAKKAQESDGLTQHERVEELTDIVRTSGLHADARVEAVRALDNELAGTTGGMERMRIMKLLLLELGGAPQPVREALAETFSECALNAEASIYLVKELVLSGKYGATAERIGVKLIDVLAKRENAGEIELIADNPHTPNNVSDYASKKLGRNPRPRARVAPDNTLMGMPLADWFKKTGEDMARARAANGVPNGGTPNGGKPKVPIRR